MLECECIIFKVGKTLCSLLLTGLVQIRFAYISNVDISGVCVSINNENKHY